MPAWEAIINSTIPFSPDAANSLRSLSNTALKGCLFFHSGCRGANAFIRSSAKASWVYMGCSVHSVPSLSKVAMRSAGGTNRGLDLSVAVRTNSMIADFAGPSFQEGRGSVAAAAVRAAIRAANTKQPYADFQCDSHSVLFFFGLIWGYIRAPLLRGARFVASVWPDPPNCRLAWGD